MPTRFASRAYPWLLGSYVGALGVAIVSSMASAPRLSADAWDLAVAAHAMVDCAQGGTWVACPGSQRFGILQNLIALPLAFAGTEPMAIVVVLTLLSVFAVAALLLLLRSAFGTTSQSGRLALLVVVAGPLVLYAALPFAEALQSLVFVAIVIAILRDRTWAIVALTALGTATRETAVVTVGLLALAAALAARGPVRSRLTAIAAGLVVGLCAIGLFNIWKFGEVTNPVYGQSLYVTPGTGLRGQMLAALWISPTGGVATFWFVGALACVGLSALALFARGSDRRTRWAAVTTLGCLAATSAGLALWYAPFGAVAWGPRLMIPTVMGASIVAIHLARPAARRLGERLAGTAVGWAAAIVLSVLTIVTALPNIGALLSDNLTASFLTVPIPGFDRKCEVLVDAGYYFDCLQRGAWQWWPSQFSRGLETAWSPAGAVLVILLTAVVALTFLPLARARERGV